MPKRGQPMVSVVGGSETVASALLPAPRLPSRMQVLRYKLDVCLRQRWPEIVCVCVCALLGVCIGLAICFSTMPVPSVVYYITRMGQWGPWPKCSSPCGAGSKRRQRTFEFDPDKGSKQCSKGGCPESHEHEDCNERPCCIPGVSNPNIFTDGHYCFMVLEPDTWDLQREKAGRRGIKIDGFGRAPDKSIDGLDVMGGELASIHSDAQNDFVFELALEWWKKQPDSSDKFYSFWIGLRCSEGPTTCYWSDGSDVDYLGLTFNYEWPKEEQCAVIDIRNDMKRTWELKSCENYFPSVRKSYRLQTHDVCPQKGQVDKCYYATDERTNWENSASDGFLATIQSREELEWIKETALQGLQESSKLWMGLRCAKDWPDRCYWVDGTSVSLNLLTEQFEGEDVLCGALSVNGDWSLEDCGDSFLAIKESAPRCDKIGFPQWTEWSPCYLLPNRTCDTVNSGHKYKLWSTPYPGAKNCPLHPMQRDRETRQCNSSCVVAPDKRPPPPATVDKGATVDRGVKRVCDWFSESEEGNEWVKHARIRGSEDIDMLEDLFHKMGYVATYEWGLIKHPYSETEATVTRRKEISASGLRLGVQCIVTDDCFWVLGQQSISQEPSVDCLPPADAPSDFRCGFSVDSTIDLPCLWHNVEGVQLFGVNGKCYALTKSKTPWLEQSNQCKNINATLATFNNSEYDTIAAIYLANQWREKLFIGLQSNKTGTYWASNGGILVNDDNVAFDDTLDSKGTGCGLLDGDKVHSSYDSNRKWTDQTYVSLEGCDQKHKAICQLPQKRTSGLDIREYPIISGGLGLSGWLAESVNWKKCRCQLFDEESKAVDVGFCYKIGSEKIKFRDFLSVGESTLEKRRKEGKELDLVTISNDLEYEEVQAVIKEYWKENLKEAAVADDPCDSVIVHYDQSSFSDSSKCFVLNQDKVERIAARQQCVQGPNGQLVTADDERLLQKLQNNFQHDGSVWTGARNVDGWKWEETGAGPRAEVWESGHPKLLDNMPLRLQCGAADPKDNYKLKAVDCLEQMPFLCRYHPSVHFITYKVKLVTGWRREWISEHVAEVKIVLEGVNGRKTDPVALNAGNGHFNQEYKLDIFSFEAVDIGTWLRSVTLFHENKGFGTGIVFSKGWHLGTVRLEIPTKKLSYFRSVNRHVFTNEKTTKDTFVEFERRQMLDDDPCSGMDNEDKVSIGSSCFVLHRTQKTFQEARADCASRDFGVLAHVRDLEQVLRLNGAFRHDPPLWRAWIGLSYHKYMRTARKEDHIEAKQWFWVDSWVPAVNTFWDDGYECNPLSEDTPKRAYDGDCAYMDFENANGRFRFEPKKCKDSKMEYICQYDLLNPCRNVDAKRLKMARGTSCYVLYDRLNENDRMTYDEARNACGPKGHLAHMTTDEMSEAFFLNWDLDGHTPAYKVTRPIIASEKNLLQSAFWVGLRREHKGRLDQSDAFDRSWFYTDSAGELFFFDDLPFERGKAWLTQKLVTTKLIVKEIRGDRATGRLYADESNENTVRIAPICEYDSEVVEYRIYIQTDEHCFKQLPDQKLLFILLNGNREVKLRWNWKPKTKSFASKDKPYTLEHHVSLKDLGQVHGAGLFIPTGVDMPSECFVKHITVEKGKKQGYWRWDVHDTYLFNMMANLGGESNSIYASSTEGYSVPAVSECSHVFPGWQVAAVTIDGHQQCFATLPDRKVNYFVAKEICWQHHKSRLATIPDDDDHINTIQKHIQIEEPVFVGAWYDDSKSLGWVWTTHTGDLAQITGTKQWKEGEPKATVDDTGICAVLDLASKKMRSVHCSFPEVHASVCQYTPPKSAHFLIGLYCSSEGDTQSCSWTDGTPLAFSHFSAPDFSLALQQSKYKCVAIRFDGVETVWVPWPCHKTIVPIYETYRYCDKVMCDQSAGCDSKATCGFQMLKQKPGWGFCRLFSGNSLIGQCCPAVKGSFRFPSFTTPKLTGCLSFANDKKFAWDDWHGSTTLAHIGSYAELVEFEAQIRLYKDPKLLYYIGAFCQRNKQIKEPASPSFYSCKWTALGAPEDGALAPDSYMWAFASGNDKWKYYKAEDGAINDRPTGAAFDQMGKLCVGFWPESNPGKLVLVDCNREMRALLQTDKYFYGLDGAHFKSEANRMPRFINDQPMRSTHLDLPIVFYLDNAQSVA